MTVCFYLFFSFITQKFNYAIQRLSRHPNGPISSIAVQLIFFGLMPRSAAMLLIQKDGNYSELGLLYLANIGCVLISSLIQVILKGCHTILCVYMFLFAIIGRQIFEHVYEVDCSFKYRLFIVYVIYAAALIILCVVICEFFLILV
jgi:hypothetical protein